MYLMLAGMSFKNISFFNSSLDGTNSRCFTPGNIEKLTDQVINGKKKCDEALLNKITKL